MRRERPASPRGRGGRSRSAPRPAPESPPRRRGAHPPEPARRSSDQLREPSLLAPVDAAVATASTSAAAASGAEQLPGGGRLAVEQRVAVGLEQPGERVERQQVAGRPGDLVERDEAGGEEEQRPDQRDGERDQLRVPEPEQRRRVGERRARARSVSASATREPERGRGRLDAVDRPSSAAAARRLALKATDSVTTDESGIRIRGNAHVDDDRARAADRLKRVDGADDHELEGDDRAGEAEAGWRRCRVSSTSATSTR